MSVANELHVVFGSGPVGLAVVDTLLAQGKRVRVVSRSGARRSLPEAVEVARGDATRPGGHAPGVRRGDPRLQLHQRARLPPLAGAVPAAPARRPGRRGGGRRQADRDGEPVHVRAARRRADDRGDAAARPRLAQHHPPADDRGAVRGAPRGPGARRQRARLRPARPARDRVAGRRAVLRAVPGGQDGPGLRRPRTCPTA